MLEATVNVTVDEEASKLIQARAGDPEAFAWLVQQHADATYRVVAGIVGDSDAEDVLQEVFLRVHRNLSKFRGEARFRTWLHRIAVNVALKRRDRLKRRSTVPFDGPEPVADHPEPTERLAAREAQEALWRAMDQLPDHQRAVVVLRGIEGLSFAEVAETLGIRKPTAESRMARAKARLKELLGIDHER